MKMEDAKQPNNENLTVGAEVEAGFEDGAFEGAFVSWK